MRAGGGKRSWDRLWIVESRWWIGGCDCAWASFLGRVQIGGGIAWNCVGYIVYSAFASRLPYLPCSLRNNTSDIYPSTLGAVLAWSGGLQKSRSMSRVKRSVVKTPPPTRPPPHPMHNPFFIHTYIHTTVGKGLDLFIPAGQLSRSRGHDCPIARIPPLITHKL